MHIYISKDGQRDALFISFAISRLMVLTYVALKVRIYSVIVKCILTITVILQCWQKIYAIFEIKMTGMQAYKFQLSISHALASLD